MLASRTRLGRVVVLGAWGPFLADDDLLLADRMDTRLARVQKPYVSVHGYAMPERYGRWPTLRVPHAEFVDWQGSGVPTPRRGAPRRLVGRAGLAAVLRR